MTYSSCRVGKVYTKYVHALDDGCQGGYGVAIDNSSVLFTLVPGVTIFVDDSERQSERDKLLNYVDLN